MNRVILITGTPCVGKTSVAKELVERLNALYVNLTDYAKQNSLISEEDPKRCTSVVDEEKMRNALVATVNQSCGFVVIDGHFAASVVPSTLVSCVFVLRRNPLELKEHMKKEKFSEDKMYENLLAEILDVCLVEALEKQAGKICEVDITGKTVKHIVNELVAIILEKQECSSVGVVDWLGLLEREGLLGQYIKF